MRNSVHTSPACPKFAFTWECAQAWQPHLAIIGASANLNVVVAGIEVVSDYTTFETSFFGYGGLSIGTNIKSFVDANVYSGVGYKGTTFSSSLEDSYSGGFLSADVGGEFVLGAGAIFAVSSTPFFKDVKIGSGCVDIPLIATPDFGAVKTICVYVDLHISPPSVVNANIASTYYVCWYTVKCTHPHCYAAVLALGPGSAAQKIVAMKLFMDKYCSTRSTDVVCVEYKKLAQFTSDAFDYMAKEGTAALDSAWKAGKSMAATVRDTFRSAVTASTNYLKTRVGAGIDAVRSLFGRLTGS